MKAISLFAGIGGFDLALQRNNIEVIYANEWDKYAAQIYDKNFNNEKETKRTWKEAEEGLRIQEDTSKTKGLKRLGGSRAELQQHTDRSSIGQPNIDTRDITTVPTKDIPNHDLLVGGFPCQAFSIAGKRRGFDDTRGTLFFEIARILKDKQPKLFILENVKGLLSHDGGNTFKTIISTLTELGYDLQWQVLNSKNFGVPQNRERVFIIGHLRGTRRPEVFPLTGTDGEAKNQLNQDQFLKWSKSRGLDNGKLRKEERLLKDSVAQTLSTGDGCFNFSSGNYAVAKQPHGVMVNRKEGIKKEVDIAGALSSSDHRGLNRNQDQTAVMENMAIRRLTPIECERLQGFPDEWTEKGVDKDGKEVAISDTQRYKVLGNAVTVNVVEEVVKRLNQK